MHEIKTTTIYFYYSFYNGYCLCHVPCVNFFLLFLFLFFFLYERIFYLQETIYRIVNSKRKHQNELLRIASLCACTCCVPISDRHTKCKCTVKQATQPAKTSVSPPSSSLSTFRAEERLRLSDRNSILLTQINVYIINPVVMGFQKYKFVPFYECYVLLCLSANELQQNSNASSRKDYIPQILTVQLEILRFYI